jgi:outer membrane immunogenic protein
MKRTFSSVVGVAALAIAVPLATASAADMAVKAGPMAPPPPSWTGCYIDGGGGYGMWNEDNSLTAPVFVAGVPGAPVTGGTTTSGGRGWLGRFGGGCDYQLSGNLSRWVIGVFGDYSFMSAKGTNNANEVIIGGAGAFPLSATENETNAGYVGGRIGYLLTPAVLSFFDGGWTASRFTQSQEIVTLTGAPAGLQYPNFDASGWFLGSGFETAVSDWLPGLPAGLFLKTEYRYASYSARNLSEFIVATGVADGNIERVRPYSQTVTTSLVWRFNWLGPWAAH